SDFLVLIKDEEGSKALKKVSFLGAERINGEIDPEAKFPDHLKYIKDKMRNNRFTVMRPQVFELGDVIKRLEQLALRKPEGNREAFRWYQQEDYLAPWLQTVLYVLLPAVLLGLIVFIFLLPRFRDPLGGGFLSNYIKSPAKRYERGKGRITFDDVAGM